MDMNTAVSLLNIKEDLLDDEVSSFEINPNSERIYPAAPNEIAKQSRNKKNKTEPNTYEKLLTSEIKKLGCTANELNAWLNKLPNTPEAVKGNALRLIAKHKLDPFLDEITIYQYEDGQWHVFITIEGCAKLLNQHPQFNGLLFNQANTLIDGVPEWIECSIYRKDREVPTTVREYYIEVRGENAIWQKMPRRILRHRALQQCVRLAMA
jgi:hypothetical protein